MKAGIGICRRPLLGALAVGLLVIGTSAFGQEIRFFPIRSAPIGSAAGTVGGAVTPTLIGGAWDFAIPEGGVEVDIDIHGGGWGNAAGAPRLGAIQATVDATGYSNGVGCDLSPKGWPGSPGDGAYQAKNQCGAGGDGAPCTPPFDGTCAGNGICIPSGDWIFKPAMAANDLAAIATPTLNYGYATAAQNVTNTFDPGGFGTFGGLIVDVPACAAGTYIIGPDTDPNNSFMTASDGSPIAGVVFTAASITVTTGSCCFNIGPGTTECADDLTQGQCDQRPGAKLPSIRVDETCAVECPTCLSDGDCEEDPPNLCTDDFCNDFVCSHVPNYDTATDCCDPATGDTTPIDDGDTCTDDVCDAGTGVVAHDCNTAPCDDGFACTVDDTCDGACGCEGTDVNTIDCTSDADCPLGECGPAGKCECSEDTPLTCTITAGAAADPNCFEDGELVQVAVGIGAGSEIVYGGQFLLGYAADCLDFISLGACDGTTFDWVIEYEVDEATGTIWYAVTTDPAAPVGSPGPEDILCIDFAFNGDCDGCNPSVWTMSQNPRNTILTNNTGNAVPIIENYCKGVRGRGEIDLVVPAGEDVNADCGLPSAIVEWDMVSATDTCDGDLGMPVCIAAHDGGLPIEHLMANGGEFPQGVSFFRCETSNSCGDTAVAVWTVDVSDQHGLHVEVHLSPTIVGDNFQRAIDFQLYLDCVSDPEEVCEVMEFGGPYNFHGHARAWLKVDKGNYQCITARDNLHTLRSAAAVECIDNAWEAVFKGDPLQGGNWLVGGNLDGKKAGGNANTIDILDAGMYLSIIAGTQGSTAPGANTSCGDLGPNADINGDGVVDSADWSFIIENFLAASKDACCPGDVGATDYIATTSITRKEAVRMGRIASFFDFDGDDDMDSDDLREFMNGAPVVSPFSTDTKKRGVR